MLHPSLFFWEHSRSRVYLSRRGILILCFRNENMSLLEVVAKIKVVLSENLSRLRDFIS